MPDKRDARQGLLDTLENVQESLLNLKRSKRETSLSPQALKAAREGLKDSPVVLSAPNAAQRPSPPRASETQSALFQKPFASVEGELAGVQTLEDIRSVLGDCRRCKLHKGRKNLVFGVGNPHAELMFVGEAPGADEDEQGEPFVGRAGQLLTKMIEAMGVKRKDVYIANVVKSRPPDNRFPEPDEVEACSPFLLAQIAVIRPKVLCALGNASAKFLLNTKDGITKLRGNFHRYGDIPVMPTYHPSYLLRNPAGKRDVWEDLQSIMELLGWENPQRKRS